VGFFGDPMQKIYLAGAGPISLENNWNEITKEENFRCPLSVVGVINAIRREDDRLQQIPAERLGLEGAIPTPEGTAKLFIVAAGQDRTAKLAEVRQWMATNTADPLWMEDNAESNVRFLVLVHRIAARRLGFADLYAALNDNGSSSLKDGLLEGTAWVLRPFLEYLLPLVAAQNAGEDFAVMSALRANCPLLTKERLVGANVSEVLARLQEALTTLVGMFQQDSTATLGEILKFVQTSELARLDDRYPAFLREAEEVEDNEIEGSEEDEESDDVAIVAFLAVPGVQLWGYQTYIKDQSPFSTHQGIKGAEFERVLVVLDDEESAYRQFSYGKYWGIEPPSASDLAHINAHEDSIIDRTRRLFYVCCSRARKDLAVVFYVPNAERARAIASAKNIFPVNWTARCFVPVRS
jgi:DNA helicase-2/ATP-dependent DNA helicase PcrA